MKNSWVKARVTEASDREYLQAVLGILDRAKKEIAVSLYLVEPNDTQGPEHPVNQLLESLLRALKRGVRVRFCLNTNFRFHPKTMVGTGSYFERLTHSGAEVFALLPSQRLHDKLIIVDARYIIEGSTNWSENALERNYESASIIDSFAHARKKLTRFERLRFQPPPRLPKSPDINRPLLPLPRMVQIPESLFEKNRLPRMIRESDQRSIDLYLILLGQSMAQGQNKLEIDLEIVGEALGLSKEWERSRIRRQVLKALRKLAKRYDLIKAEFPYGRNAKITVKNLKGEMMEVPGSLLEPSALVQQSSAATFLALTGELLKKEGVDMNQLSAPELEKRFSIGKSSLNRARILTK